MKKVIDFILGISALIYVMIFWKDDDDRYDYD